MIGFDYTIRIGDIVNSGVGVILILIGRGLKKTYDTISNFFDTVDNMDRRIEDTADVVDVHSTALERAGWLTPAAPRVSHRRRKRDTQDDTLGLY